MDHHGIPEPNPEPLGNPLTAWGAAILMCAIVGMACGFVVLALAYGLRGLVTTLSHRPAAVQAGGPEQILPEQRCVQV